MQVSSYRGAPPRPPFLSRSEENVDSEDFRPTDYGRGVVLLTRPFHTHLQWFSPLQQHCWRRDGEFENFGVRVFWQFFTFAQCLRTGLLFLVEVCSLSLIKSFICCSAQPTSAYPAAQTAYVQPAHQTAYAATTPRAAQTYDAYQPAHTTGQYYATRTQVQVSFKSFLNGILWQIRIECRWKCGTRSFLLRELCCTIFVPTACCDVRDQQDILHSHGSSRRGCHSRLHCGRNELPSWCVSCTISSDFCSADSLNRRKSLWEGLVVRVEMRALGSVTERNGVQCRTFACFFRLFKRVVARRAVYHTLNVITISLYVHPSVCVKRV